MTHLLFEPVMQKLKSVLKRKGITYAGLGSKVGITESGIKKIFSGKDCSFNRLESICNAVGVELADLIDAAANEPRQSRQPKLSERQEAAFSADTDLLVFYLLLRVYDFKLKTIQKLGQKDGLSATMIDSYVQRLQRLELLAETAGDVAVPTCTPSIGSHLHRKYFQSYVDVFVRRVQGEWQQKTAISDVAFGNYRASEKTIRQMKQAFAALQREFQARIEREEKFLKPEESHEIGVVTAILPIDWKRSYLEMLQPKGFLLPGKRR